MGKYNDIPITRHELAEIATLIKTLHKLNHQYIVIDHIQIGDINGDILGKIQLDVDPDDDDENNGFAFHPRKHDKPGTLGE